MKTFQVSKDEVIELGEGHSSKAKRDGEAYFTEDGVAMVPVVKVASEFMSNQHLAPAAPSQEAINLVALLDQNEN